MTTAAAEPLVAPPAPTLTCEVEAAADAVKLTVGVPASAANLFVWRYGPSGVLAYIRGAYSQPVTGPATIIIRDYEAPIGVPLFYGASVFDAGGTSSAQTSAPPITVPTLGCDDTWLTDLVRPTNTQRIIIENLAELAYQTPRGVHYILDRRTPIVSTGIAKTPSFELLFITETDDERGRARAALGNGVPLLLRTPPENGIGSIFFACLEWKEQRIVQKATVQDRRFVVSAVQVDRPDPALFLPIGPATYATIKTKFATYADLKAQRASYDALLYDYTGTKPSDIVPWPPDDV